MQPHSDLLIDRKRLKRRLTAWRTLCFLLVFGAMAVMLDGGPLGRNGSNLPGKDYIAEISIEGIMFDDQKRDALIKDVRDDKHAKAVIVRLDSPGGTTVAGEEIFIQLRQIAEKKPVVGMMRTICASACYMASLAADHVIARDGTLTGSIGVMIESVEVSRLADKLGITPVSIKSGPYKNVPDIAKPFSDEQRKVVGELVVDAYDRFVGMIVDRRKLDEETVRKLADGRVYTGHQAFNLKLIDGIGGEDEALDWLSQNREISPKLEIREVRPAEEYESLLDHLAQATGIKIFNRSAMGLDGLVSIWHPSGI